MSTRLTSAALLPTGAAAVVGYLAVRADNGWLWLLAAAAAGALGCALVLRPRVGDLTISLDAPVRTGAGEVVRHVVAVRNTGARPSSPARLLLRTAGHADLRCHIPTLAPGEAASAELERAALHRARAEASTAVLDSSVPLGLVRGQRQVLVPGATVVHPTLLPVTLGPSGPAAAAGGDVSGVRDWRPGDPVRGVHWRATARRGAPVLLERADAPPARLAVLVVGPAAARGWEAAVTLAASAALAALAVGRAVRLVADHAGPAPLEPATRDAALDWCAGLTNPGWPAPGLLDATLRWTGRGGDLLVAVPTAVPAQWWAQAQAAAAQAGVRLGLLRLAADGPPA